MLNSWRFKSLQPGREGILQPQDTPHAPPTPSPPLTEVGSSVWCQARAHTGSVMAQCCRHKLRSPVWTTLSVSSGKWRQSWCSRSRSSNPHEGCKDGVEFWDLSFPNPLVLLWCLHAARLSSSCYSCSVWYQVKALDLDLSSNPSWVQILPIPHRMSKLKEKMEVQDSA